MRTYRPLAGHAFHSLTDAELQFIIRDASLAAIAMHSLENRTAEDKYLDQANDAATILGYRRRVAAGRESLKTVSNFVENSSEKLLNL